ncbi:MAG: hypothetical protein IKZ31_04495, partial [Lentisphaeria bacterium]|nr:hypothetical protein [Lentisphaeria bacterium]
MKFFKKYKKRRLVIRPDTLQIRLQTGHSHETIKKAGSMNRLFPTECSRVLLTQSNLIIFIHHNHPGAERAGFLFIENG